MSEIQAKIDELEAEMARTQKNKATNYHLGMSAPLSMSLTAFKQWLSPFCGLLSYALLFLLVRIAVVLTQRYMSYHLGTLKAKIAKLKSELINGPGGKAAVLASRARRRGAP